MSIYRLVVCCISVTGFFLSAWVLLPAPIFSLLPLAIGAPEVSPWLWGLNILGGLLSLQSLPFVGKFTLGRISRINRTSPPSPTGWTKKLWLPSLTLGLSSFGLFFSLVPIAQLPRAIETAETAMVGAIGQDYLQAITKENRLGMRPQPFVLLDAWRGIPSSTVRYTPGIPLDPEANNEVRNKASNEANLPLALDLYRPPPVGNSPGNYPAIVIIHGGAWQGGSPREYGEFSRYMAARGYVVWAITYRYAPKYKFPAQLEDVQKALKFIQHHGREYETDLGRMALLGRSAGAQLAMLAAYGSEAPPIRAVVDYYGPVDLTAGYYDVPSPDPIDSRAILLDFLGGTPEQVGSLYHAASPIDYVNRPLPPSLLIYGGKDHIVMAKFGQALAQKLTTFGTPTVFMKIPWADHAFDAVFSGISNQLALYYTERFLAYFLKN